MIESAFGAIYAEEHPGAYTLNYSRGLREKRVRVYKVGFYQTGWHRGKASVPDIISEAGVFIFLIRPSRVRLPSISV